MNGVEGIESKDANWVEQGVDPLHGHVGALVFRWGGGGGGGHL